MLFDPKNYPNLFTRGKTVNLWFTNIIRKNHAYNQRTKWLSATSEGETLHFIVVHGQWLIVTFGKYSANGRDRPVILHFKFFPTDRALSILREKTGENFPSETAQIFNNKMRAFVCYCIHLGSINRPYPARFSTPCNKRVRQAVWNYSIFEGIRCANNLFQNWTLHNLWMATLKY